MEEDLLNPLLSGDRAPLLMIFIDGFPYKVLQKGDFFIKKLSHMAPLQPGFGFSVNIFVELYAGLTPDEAGYLNIWEHDPGEGAEGTQTLPFWNWTARRIADRLTRRPQQFSRLVHKVYERIVGEGNIGNIPFAYLPYYRRTVSNDTIRYIFDELGLSVFRHELIPGSIWDRDEAAFRQALGSIKRGESVFVTFGSLDHTGHLAGPSSSRFMERACLIDKWCEEMIESFLAACSGNGYIAICSDHGQADVDAGIELNFEKEFGRPSSQTYWYFLDSTMARLWVKDTQLKKEIVEFLQQQPNGTLLDADMRTNYGISNNVFMDAVFVLQEGKVLWPSWAGGWLPKGMHGYLPEEPSQQAIFVFHAPEDNAKLPAPLPTRSRDVYQFFRALKP